MYEFCSKMYSNLVISSYLEMSFNFIPTPTEMELVGRCMRSMRSSLDLARIMTIYIYIYLGDECLVCMRKSDIE